MSSTPVKHSVLEGTAYGRPQASPDDLLTRVGPGTPCGEFMRRYWQPVRVASKVTQRPQEVRLLGENLILFRDGNGRPGLLYPRCMHRGTNLFWGHVEQDGIRCCYHGWKFDVEGNCIDQQCEPNGGLKLAAHRQPWYPVEEHYGLIWAYMGPPDKMPVFPKFDCMELEEGERYVALDDSSLSHADPNGPEVVPYSWLNANDNVLDPAHIHVLHSTFSTTQFVEMWAPLPKVKFETIESGAVYKADWRLDDGRLVRRIVSWFSPNIACIPSATGEPGGAKAMAIFLPVDDTHTRLFAALRVGANFTGMFAGAGFDSLKPWHKMTVEERQDAPNDYEAQSGQGTISLHSEEHLVKLDAGIGMQRRILRREIEKVARGEDPVGVSFDPNNSVIRVPSANIYFQPDEEVVG